MPRATPQQELDFLAALIGAEPDGLGIDALLQQLGAGWQRRTLQRRLALLAKQERLQLQGVGRAVRYRSASHCAPVEIPLPSPTAAPDLSRRP